MAIDTTALSGATGLVKSHTVTSDSETTVMRSIDEVKALDQFLTGKAVGCNRAARAGVMRSIFGVVGVASVFGGDNNG